MSSELRIFVPIAIRATINSLIPRLETASGLSVTQLIDLNPAIPERISAGEAYDIGLTNSSYAKALISAGHADGASHHSFGRVPLAVGRKAGTENRISKDLKGIKALFHEAESIAYTGAGTSGRTYVEVMEQLGLTNAIVPKSQAMGGGEPVASVAAGETELAVAPLTTVLATPGIVPAAIFPEELGANIDMSIFLSTTPQTGAATALAFLTADELNDELAAAGILRFELN
ncbi:substrate-binding domain-containing protein [Marimonas lutisalis]|uniref:substrate-binding domain-containing protein n=1 Tax=Marimonas lutisalis TaxID=2545756 RepID=UPI0010F990B7|nr:substrate-binding domain-containing protein [Marimonas lutisalis]